MDASHVGPKRILAIDGGGLRGVAAIAFLERLEQRLRSEHGVDYKLHEHFDLIGGTSTGSIIATSLALGQSLKEIKQHYFHLAPNVFRRSWSRIPFVQSTFKAEALRREFRNIVGDRTLETPDLKTYLAIVTKRLDTGSVWFLSNNPNSTFWDSPENGAYLGNRYYPLANIIRASTAAPLFFDPQLMEIVRGRAPGLFVDGGVSPYNNPSLAMLQMATIVGFGFSWQTGVDNLSITSIGCGSSRHRLASGGLLSRLAAPFAVNALYSMIADNDRLVLTLMHGLGRCESPWTIDSQIGKLNAACMTPEPLFRFERYDLRLEREWLAEEIGVDVSEPDLVRFRDLSSLSSMQSVYDLAARAAEKQMP